MPDRERQTQKWFDVRLPMTRRFILTGREASQAIAGYVAISRDPMRQAGNRMGSIATRPALLALAAALIAAVNLAVWFPGEAGPDSQAQYAQVLAGQFDDWHPPIMAWLWSVFRLLADGDAPMFCFQIACYWLGFGLMAHALAQAGRPLAAWVMLGVALFPSFLTLSTNLLGDVGMAVTFLAAVGALFWHRVQGREVPPATAAAAAALILYGALVRTNAVFAVVPLAAYLIRPQWLRRPWRVLLLSLPVALALVPAASFFNQRVLGAQSLEKIRALQVFDLAGIAFQSGDLAVFGPDNTFTSDEVFRCYDPTFWDRLSPWGQCGFFWNRLAVSRDQQASVENVDARTAMGATPNPDLRDLWIAAIVHHPLAYAQHRLTHFFSEISRGASSRDPDSTAPSPSYLILYDWVTASAAWLALGVGLLVWLAAAHTSSRPASRDAALALLLSALPFAFAYLIIGVATELRYMLWSLIAIFTAAVLSLPPLRSTTAAQAAVAQPVTSAG
ncbi:MAG TPA: hypothetical protein VGG01_23920 [Xanthobacteraceae bacterium]